MMKHSYYLTVLMLILGIFTFNSCSDDNDEGLTADVNRSIVGVWQNADHDLRGDDAFVGIIVHEDGTVTEWIYHSASTWYPHSILFKTGKWSVNGNHYEMQLPTVFGKHYNVTVVGNNDSLMYLAYNGKTSVVPFHRLGKLPGDGDIKLKLLMSMKTGNFTMSDLTGYWAYTGEDGTVYNNGFYIDAEGNVSEVESYPDGSNFIQHSIKYHTGKVTINTDHCTIPYQGLDYELFGVNDSTMLVGNEGLTLEKLVRQNLPQDIALAEGSANSYKIYTYKRKQ